MSHVTAFLEGMRSAFDLAPQQKTHKANFITGSKSPKVIIDIPALEDAGAWKAVSSYARKSGKSYQLKHNGRTQS